MTDEKHLWLRVTFPLTLTVRKLLKAHKDKEHKGFLAYKLHGNALRFVAHIVGDETYIGTWRSLLLIEENYFVKEVMKDKAWLRYSDSSATIRELRRLPHRNHWNEDVICDSLIILPAQTNAFDCFRHAWRVLCWKVLPRNLYDRMYISPPSETHCDYSHLHDSGYRCMDFVAVRYGIPMCRLSGCSDVIHVGGIGGFGRHWLEKFSGVPKLLPPTPWSIDCLPKSGLLRLFAHDHKLVCGSGLSSFELFAIKTKEENTNDD